MVPRRFVVTLPQVLVITLALGLTVSTASAQQPVPAAPAPSVAAAAPVQDNLSGLAAGTVIGNGQIYDLVRDGDRLYAFGGFEKIGRYSGPGGVLDGSTGDPQASPLIGDGQVSVVVADGAGGWYLGGDFSSIDDQPAGGVAHILADGTLDPGFLPITDGLVSAVSLVGTTLYIGGDFRHVNDATRSSIAAVSVVDGTVLPFDASQGPRVTELVATPTAVYVGSNGLVAVDPVTGAPLGGFSSPVTGQVHALAMGGDQLYVGTQDLVALDPTTGAQDPAFDPAPPQNDRAYHSLLYTGSILYVGSDRTDRLEALDPDTGAADPAFAPSLAGQNSPYGDVGGVYDLALDGDRLWAGGSFVEAGGDPAHGLAVFDAETGAREDSGLPAYNKQVNAVELAGGDVYVGGTFYMTDWMRSNGIAVLDAETLDPDPGFTVKRYAYGDPILSPSVLYVAPNHFQGFDKRPESTSLYYDYSSRIWAFDPDTGAMLPDLNRKVRNMSGATTIGDRLYVSRRLESDVKFPRNRVDVYNAAGRRVDTFDLPLRGYVTTLTSIQGDLIAAGSFKRSTAAGFPRNTAMLRIDPATGERRPSFDPKIHGPVYDVVVQGGSLFASGLFKEVFQLEDSDRPGLTKMSAQSRQDGTFTPNGFGGNRVLLRLHAAGDLLFLDGGGQRLLDSSTGEHVTPPAGVPDYLSAFATAPGGYTFADYLYPNLGGSSYSPIGYISRVD